MNAKTLLAAALIATVATGAEGAESEADIQIASKVHEYHLDNAMTVIVKEDHSAPVVVSQVWYRVGAADEHNGITGVSHVLEHMMFKGTERYPEGHFSATISRLGGSENAFTGDDYTAYFEILESSRLETALELEADRMRNLTLMKQNFLTELEVVKEERRLRTEDDPQALTYEQLSAVAFTNSPYQHPVIGWMADLKAMDLEDVRHWYQTWYWPNNATLVVAGDVNPDRVYQLAKRYFGPIESHLLPERQPQGEHRQRGERRLTVRVPAEVPYLIVAYKTPVLRPGEKGWEPYALAVLAGILDAGASARLSQRLVRGKEILASAGAGYGLYGRYHGLFTLEATPAQDHTVAAAEAALTQEIKALRTELVDEAELERVKAQVVASEVYGLDSLMSQATRIGALETIGLGWQVMTNYVERIQAVTAEQVRKVARQFLVDRRKTVAVLDPLPIGAEDEDEQAGARPSGLLEKGAVVR